MRLPFTYKNIPFDIFNGEHAKYEYFGPRLTRLVKPPTDFIFLSSFAGEPEQLACLRWLQAHIINYLFYNYEKIQH